MERFAVIGLGRFGAELACTLAAEGAEVIALDRQVRLVEAIRDKVTLAVRLDSTDEQALQAQGVADCHAAIVSIGDDFEAAVLTVATLQSLGVGRIIARAESDTQAEILRRIGATSIVNPERESARRWTHRLMMPRLEQYVELAEGYSMVTIPSPKAFHNQSLAGLELRQKYGVNVVAIRREVTVATAADAPAVATPTVTVPTPDTVILPKDRLILVGSDESLSRLPAD